MCIKFCPRLLVRSTAILTLRDTYLNLITIIQNLTLNLNKNGCKINLSLKEDFYMFLFQSCFISNLNLKAPYIILIRLT